MSSGEVSVVPVAAIVLAPVVVGGAVVVGAVMATEAVIMAHYRSRIRSQQARRAVLVDHAGRLRIQAPAQSTEMAGSVSSARTLVATLAKENAEWESRLEQEQATLDTLRVTVAEATGRHTNLARWVGEVETSATPLSGVPTFGQVSASEEARLQIAALAADNETLETALRAAHARLDAQHADAAWRSIAIPLVADLDRDPQSSIERWRTVLRERLANAVRGASALGRDLPGAVADAAALIESSRERDDAERAVARAVELLEDAKQERAVRSSLESELEALIASAEAMEDYLLAERCDEAGEEYLAKVAAGVSVRDLELWARPMIADLHDGRRRSEETLAAVKAAELERLRLAVQEAGHSALLEALLKTHTEVELTPEMEIFRPSGGKLLRREGSATLVAVWRGFEGETKIEPIKIGSMSAEAEAKACDDEVEFRKEKVLPEAQRLFDEATEELGVLPIPLTFRDAEYQPLDAVPEELFGEPSRTGAGHTVKAQELPPGGGR